MDAIELLELVSLGETSTVQFEHTAEGPHQLAAELCAFANTSGGRLLIGVEDDGTISGLDPHTLRNISSLVTDVASNNLLVHRNDFITASLKVFVFANRIELHSPGTLPNALTVEQIKLGSGSRATRRCPGSPSDRGSSRCCSKAVWRPRCGS